MFFNVKVRFLVVALFIGSLFLYHIVKVSVMVLSTHDNVTVRPSKSWKLNPSSNLTSTDAAKPNVNGKTLWKCSFFCTKPILNQCHPAFQALNYSANIIEKVSPTSILAWNGLINRLLKTLWIIWHKNFVTNSFATINVIHQESNRILETYLPLFLKSENQIKSP